VLVLSVIQGPDKGKKFVMPDHEPQLIGRSSEAVPLNDTTISRRHSELTPDRGEWFIRDLDSQNGTYVNGVRIAERTRLRPGDQVRTGATLMIFGVTEVEEPDVVKLLKPGQIDAAIERTMISNEDSVVLSEPEPRQAAVEHLRVIYQLTTITSQQVIDRQELLRAVMELVFDEFKPERGFIMLFGAAPASAGGVTVASGAPGAEAPLRPAVVKYKTPPRDRDEARIHVSRTILQHCLRQGEGVLSTNAMTDARFASGDSIYQMAVRSAICSPIRYRDRTFGALYIDSTMANYTFTPEQLALMNAIGQHTGLALANTELYAQKLQGERLAAVGETVASLSHSIKNILQGLRGGADVVEMGLRKDDLKIAKGGWAILKRNLDRIMGLTLNMLAYSRQRHVELELMKLGPLIEDCAQLLQTQCAAKQVAMIIDVDPEMPPIPLDAALVHQAMMNLMGNAVEAVEPGTGAVTVRAAYHPAPEGAASANHAAGDPRNRAYAEIAVLDNGPGIPDDRLPWIFEPFNSTKGVRGTGLGLPVTKRVVEEHGGRLEVDGRSGQAAGRGATFRIILPAESTTIDPSATAHSRAG